MKIYNAIIRNKNIEEPIIMETEKKKKGLLATIWESMTKTRWQGMYF